MNKKEIAVTFLKAAATGDVQAAYEKHVHPDFVHHNPYFKGDRQSLLEAMAENARQMPDKVYEIVRSLEDGDLVAVHGKVRLDKNSPEIALMHIFRFDGDKVIEAWEVSQEVPADSPNEHGMF